MNRQHEFNERFRAYVCERYPDWSHQLVLEGTTDSEADFLSLRLLNPRGEIGPALEVRTEELRMTVFFGMNHAHFESEQVEAAITPCCELVEGILQERIVSVVLYQGASPYVSDFCHVEDLPAVEETSRPPPEPGLLRRILGMGERPGPGTTTTWRSYGPVHYVLGPLPAGTATGPRQLGVVSWLGTHDRLTVLT